MSNPKLQQAIRRVRYTHDDEQFLAAYDIETVDAEIERLTAELEQAKAAPVLYRYSVKGDHKGWEYDSNPFFAESSLPGPNETHEALMLDDVIELLNEQAAPVAVPDNRYGFEQWALSRGCGVSKHPVETRLGTFFEYESSTTEILWQSWVASRAMLNATPPATAVDEQEGESCVCCANGNDLPDGEYCRACGRENNISKIARAVKSARGGNSPPSKRLMFSAKGRLRAQQQGE